MTTKAATTGLFAKGALVLSLALAPSLCAADSVETLTKELIELRDQVETLHGQLQAQKDEHKSRMKSYAMQKAELEANLQRETLKIKQIRQSIGKVQEQTKKKSVSSDELVPAVQSSIQKMREYVETSIPFKKKERLAGLDEIEQLLLSKTLPAEKAANRLWAFAEDELRMTRENGIFRQTVEIDGEMRLTDVARLGTIMMFYKTGDNKVGMVQKGENGWSYVALVDPQATEQVVALFDGLQKQIRTGYYELPGAAMPGLEN